MNKPAPKKPNAHIKINMLHPQGEPLHLAALFLKWLTGYGRYVIIIVEVVVLLCFGAKFKLQADSESLSHQIDTEASSIQANADKEATIKSFQQKLQQVQQNFDSTPQWALTISNIAQRTPQSVKITTLNLDHSQAGKALQFKISATSNINSDVTYFINTLKGANVEEKDRVFKDINLAGISYDQGNLVFTLTGSTK